MNTILSFKNAIITNMLTIVVMSVTAQTWQPLGPDYKKELGFGQFYNSNIKIINDSLYTMIWGGGKAIVKKYDGNSWEDFTTIFPHEYPSVSPAPNKISIALSKHHEAYVFYDDVFYYTTGAYKGSVKEFINGSWQLVGNPAFTISAIAEPYITTDTGGVPYVVYTDPSNAYQPKVMKFDGTNWVVVGDTAFTIFGASSPILKFDNNNTPYFAFIDHGGLNKVNVMKLFNNVWTYVGGYPGISALNASFLSMELDNNGDPYVCYSDGANSNKATVMKYNGTTWSTVGTPGFTSAALYSYSSITFDNSNNPFLHLAIDNSSTHTIMAFNSNVWNTVGEVLGKGPSVGSIVIAPDGNPVATYSALSYHGKVVMKKFNSTSWEKVGIYGLTPDVTFSLDMALNYNNDTYIAFSDSSFNQRLSVMKYDNGNWGYVGPPGISPGKASEVCIAAGKSDTVFVAYRNDMSGGKAIVTMFDGTSWITLGSGSNIPSLAYAAFLSLTVDTNNIPYIAFADNTQSNKAVVRKYEGGIWTTLGTVASSNGINTPMCLKIDKMNVPYLVSYASIKKFENGSWQQVGINIPFGEVSKYCLQFDKNNIPYIGFPKHIQVTSLSGTFMNAVVKLVGNTWISVGTPNGIDYAPYSSVVAVDLTLDTSGHPYIATSYDYAPYTTTGKIIISGWNGINWVHVNDSATGWSKEILADVFRLEMGTNNILTTSFCYGGAFALGNTQPSAPPTPPIVISPINYCLGDTAVALTASGSNLLWYSSPTGTGTSIPPVPNTTLAGTYTFYVSQTNGIWESEKDSITVIIHPKPIPVITSNNNLLTTNVFTSYQWYYNGSIIPNANNPSYTVTQNGDYSVFVTDTNGCSNISSDYTMVQSPLPILPTDSIAYCQNDTASMLIANGQNILWYDALTSNGSNAAPTPSTTVPGVTVWYVSQNTTTWESEKDSIVVTVHPLPTPTVWFNIDTLFTGSFTIYQWGLNGTDIPNASSQSYIATQDGDYTVTVTDTNGCMNTSPVFSYTSTNGIPSIQTESIQVYPNPADRTIHIQSSLPVRSTLTTMSGATIFKNIPDKDVNISDLPNGLYLLKIKDQQGRLLKTEKITKLQE